MIELITALIKSQRAHYKNTPTITKHLRLTEYIHSYHSRVLVLFLKNDEYIYHLSLSNVRN